MYPRFPGILSCFNKKKHIVDGRRKWTSLFLLARRLQVSMCVIFAVWKVIVAPPFVRKEKVHLRYFYDFSFNKRWLWRCANVRVSQCTQFTVVILYFQRFICFWTHSISVNHFGALRLHIQKQHKIVFNCVCLFIFTARKREQKKKKKQTYQMKYRSREALTI